MAHQTCFEYRVIFSDHSESRGIALAASTRSAFKLIESMPEYIGLEIIEIILINSLKRKTYHKSK